MKNETIFILIAFLTFITLYSKAQTTVEFSTGFVNVPSNIVIEDYSDTHLSLRVQESNTGSDFVGGDLLLINKQTLSIADTLFHWDMTSATFQGGFVDFFTDSNGKKYYAELGKTAVSGELILNYYSMNDDYSLDSLLVTKKWNDRYTQQLGFINDELIVIYSNAFPVNDTVYIETFDTIGSMLQSRLYAFNNSNLNQVYLAGHTFNKILKHPQLNKAFVLSHYLNVKVFVVNQNSLDTIRTYNAMEYGGPGNANLMNYGGYFQMYNNNVRMDYDGIILAGDAWMKPYYLSNNDLTTNDYQYYSIKQFWDDTYEIQNFGPIDINNGFSGASEINELTKTQVIAGSIPSDDFSYITNEKREILIYLYDQWGKYDSIFIHGNKNHTCTDILVEDNGDIFIAGMYSNAWSTDSVYNWLTKIPGVAVGMIEQEKMNNHLFLYPNPTVEQIQIKEVAKFINGEYEIYSQTGVLVKQGKVTGQEIDVSSFISGVYVITVKNENGEQFNAIFVKK
jgi:hypothetical protein